MEYSTKKFINISKSCFSLKCYPIYHLLKSYHAFQTNYIFMTGWKFSRGNNFFPHKLKSKTIAHKILRN